MSSYWCISLRYFLDRFALIVVEGCERAFSLCVDFVDLTLKFVFFFFFFFLADTGRFCRAVYKVKSP